LPNGTDIWVATDQDFTAAGWRIDISAQTISTAHVCLTVPATRGPAPFIDGACPPFGAL
jgi:hypothetical protein